MRKEKKKNRIIDERKERRSIINHLLFCCTVNVAPGLPMTYIVLDKNLSNKAIATQEKIITDLQREIT